MALQIFDDFEDGDVAEWTVNDFSAVQDRVFNGSWSAKADNPQSGSYQARRDIVSGGGQIKQFEFFWQETQFSYGHALSLFDSNGDRLIGVGSDNPQWFIDDTNGPNRVYGGDGYDRWIRVTVVFDWGAGTADVTMEDMQSGYQETFSDRPLKQDTDVEAVQIDDYTGGTYQEGGGIDTWFDYIRYDPGFTFSVSTGEATDVESSSATLNGTLDDLGGNSSLDVYFEWREVGDSTWNTTSTQSLSSTGSFSDSITGLGEGVDYEFRAVADDGSTQSLGSILTFTTLRDVEQLSDYDHNKSADATSLNSASLTGFPAFIRIEQSGDTTGTGVWGIDTNASIDGVEDFGFFDENGNALYFYAVTVDHTNGVYEFWVRSDITLDGGEEIILGYGNGSFDDTTTKQGVWGNVSGIEAVYDFDGNVNDITGNGYDATTVSGVTYGDSELGQAGIFDGSDWVDIPNNFGFDGFQDFTILTYFEADQFAASTNPGDAREIIHFRGEYNLFAQHFGDGADANALSLRINDDSDNWETKLESNGLSTNTWYMGVTAYDSSGGYELDIDDTTQDIYNGTDGYSTGNINNGIGHNNSGRYYDGRIALIQIYSSFKQREWRKAQSLMTPKGGYSLFSANASQPTDTQAPTAPSNLSKSNIQTTQVDLDWDASSDSGGSGLDHYNIYEDIGSGFTKLKEVSAGTTSTTVTSGSEGASYDYYVTAVDGAGNESSPSNTVTVNYKVSKPSDYNKTKKLSVDSVSGTPTVDKAQPVLLVGGNDSTTGNGDIVLDWTNISGPEDIAIYDQNGNLLDYEIEELDTTAETGVLWCYNSWVRDGTTQAQIVYGSNSQDVDRQNVTATWGNSGQNAEMVQHLQDDPLTATDSTSNNNDGTVNGATSINGEFDGAASFDGVDDWIELGAEGGIIGNPSEFTFVAYANHDDKGAETVIRLSNPAFIIQGGDPNYYIGGNTGGGNFENLAPSYSTNTDYFWGASWDGSTLRGYRDGDDIGSVSVSGWADVDDGPAIGVYDRGDNGSNLKNYMNGVIDEVRVYSESKSADWMQAEYDASPKAGQVFFSQQAAETTAAATTKTVTETLMVNETFTKNLIQQLLLSLDEVLTVSETKDFVQNLFRGFNETLSAAEARSLALSIKQNEGFSVDVATGKQISKTFDESFTVNDLYLDNTGFIKGTVTVDGSTVEGANVYIVKSGAGDFKGAEVTDSNGEYSIGQVVDDNSRYLVAVDFDDGTDSYGFQKSIEVNFN